MLNRIFLSALLAGALLGLALAIPYPMKALTSAVQSETKTDVFKVTGMTCGGCEVGVRMAVGKLDGVEKVEASYKEGTATIKYDPAKVTPKQIEVAIGKLGYQAKLQK